MSTLQQPSLTNSLRAREGSHPPFLRELRTALTAVLFFAVISIRWASTGPQVVSAREDAYYAAYPDARRSVHAVGSSLAAAAPFAAGQHQQPLAERLIAVTRLEQVGVASVPQLVADLNSPDPNVRLLAVQVLGWLHADSATPALLKSTYDGTPDVREAAIRALGQLRQLTGLPRLQELQVAQSNFFIQQEAFVAEQELYAHVAAELGLGLAEVHTVTVARESGWAYATTSQGIYAKRDGDWLYVDTLPAPTGVVATDATGRLVFAATENGLVKSLDGGDTWQPTAIGSWLGAPATVTALVVDPRNGEQIYAALAVVSASSTIPLRSMGIYSSSNGGSFWSLLQDSLTDLITTRLALDASAPDMLFGSTGVGTWRYALHQAD
jgi:hypothetical protein